MASFSSDEFKKSFLQPVLPWSESLSAPHPQCPWLPQEVLPGWAEYCCKVWGFLGNRCFATTEHSIVGAAEGLCGALLPAHTGRELHLAGYRNEYSWLCLFPGVV